MSAVVIAKYKLLWENHFARLHQANERSKETTTTRNYAVIN